MIACVVPADGELQRSNTKSPINFEMSTPPEASYSPGSLSSSSSTSSLSSSASECDAATPHIPTVSSATPPRIACGEGAVSNHKQLKQEYQQRRRQQRRASSQVVQYEAVESRIAPFRDVLKAVNYSVINCMSAPSSLIKHRHKRRGASVDNFDDMAHRRDYDVLFQAVSQSDGRLHAVRVVDKNDNPNAYAMMMREGWFLNSLRHRNVVHFHDAIVQEHFGLLVTEYCARGSALDVVSRTTDGLGETDALTLVSGALRALRFAHSRGVAHRAVTLRAILVSANGTPRLASFHSAILLPRNNGSGDDDLSPQPSLVSDESSPSTSAVLSDDAQQQSDNTRAPWDDMGIKNVEYAPPEALLGGTFVSPTGSDIWSVGIVLYALLTKATRFGNSAWLRVTPKGVVADIGPLLADPRVAATSRTCRSLLAGLLSVNPTHRLSAHDALIMCNTALAAAPLKRM